LLIELPKQVFNINGRNYCFVDEKPDNLTGFHKRTIFRSNLNYAHPYNVNFYPVLFQEFSTTRTFDIVLLHASINHLDEEACIRLQYDDQARRRYGLIFQRLSAR